MWNFKGKKRIVCENDKKHLNVLSLFKLVWKCPTFIVRFTTMSCKNLNNILILQVERFNHLMSIRKQKISHPKEESNK